MGNSYYNAEKRADMELRNKREKEEIEMLEEIIRGLMEDPLKNGLTEEQMFLIKYYDLDEQEVQQKNFDISNVEQTINSKSEMQREQLETNRYEALIDMFSSIEDFKREERNKINDCFHKDIKEWNDYTKDFEKDSLIIKKMRNLQLLNNVAHKYEAIFRGILYRKNPEINKEYTAKDKKKIEYNIGEMFSIVKSDAENATQELVKQFGAEKVSEWKNDKILKYCINASKWMFKQKETYIADVLRDLQNTNEEYNYGVLEDSFVFDVPEYGQFSVHMGKNNMKKINALRQSYSVKDYEGDYLGDVYILSKADSELLASVNYDELSELDKQRYRIACPKTREKKAIKEKGKSNLEHLIEGAKDKERAHEIINIIRDAGLDPEKVVTKTLLDKGNTDAIKDVIEIISQNEYGIGLDILTRCKTLLSVSQNKAIDIMEILDKINKLGIDPNITTEYPNFLTVSKSDKLEPIYDVVKQYKIDLTNHNIAVAFEGNPENIKRNMDLVIENGLYDLAKIGVNKFFTSNNKNLNMRINLLKKNNTPLTTETEGKRKINATLFKTEKDLMKMYGIDKKQILDELSRVRGQELIRDNKYYVEEEEKEIVLSEEQQEITNIIYEKLNKNQLEEGIVIKIGDYFYSAIKVKEQINSIIAKLDIHDLENENADEILKIALFKNKNIDQKEIDEVSEQIENLTKENAIQEEVKEEIIDEANGQGESNGEIENNEQQEEPNEEIEDNEQQEETNEEIEDIEQQEEQSEENSEYEEIREMTSDIIEKQQNIENIEQIISKLKETRKTLKHQIKEMEEKINNSILNNDEPTSEVIEDIKKMKEIVKKQKEKRKEVKQMIKRYKENKKIMKYTLKQEKEARNSAIDDLEL